MAGSYRRITGEMFRDLRKKLGLTQAETARLLRLESDKSVRDYEKDRREKGVPFTAYALLKAEYDRKASTVPLVGEVPAGAADQPEEVAIGSVAWPRPHLDRAYFALIVRGESVRSSGVSDGDVVIVESNPEARSGLVIATIDGEATLKELRYVNGHPTLVGDTNTVTDFRGRELRIIGAVVDRIRPKEIA